LAPVIKPTSSSGSSSSSNNSQLSDGAIAGIVIGCVIFGMCVAGLMALLVFTNSKTSSTVAGSSNPNSITNKPAIVSTSEPAVNPEAELNSPFSIGEDAP
jgi:hypothetical protein